MRSSGGTKATREFFAARKQTNESSKSDRGNTSKAARGLLSFLKKNPMEEAKYDMEETKRDIYNKHDESVSKTAARLCKGARQL